jgi:hypothetical protein
MSNRVTQDRCGECKFYFAKAGENGECHRHAPQVVVMKTVGEGNNTFTRWPEVTPDQSCGDFVYANS